jgi:hypothetical protein
LKAQGGTASFKAAGKSFYSVASHIGNTFVDIADLFLPDTVTESLSKGAGETAKAVVESDW